MALNDAPHIGQADACAFKPRARAIAETLNSLSQYSIEPDPVIGQKTTSCSCQCPDFAWHACGCERIESK
jgi:hypothetical protein